MKLDKIGYYFITDSRITNLSAVKQVQAVVESRLGVRFYQYREKEKSAADMVKEVRDIRSILPRDAYLIVNDRLDIALGYADGVNLGDDDIPVQKVVEIVRDRLKDDRFIIGSSASTLDYVRMLNGLDIDYVSFGPVFITTTKKEAPPAVGINALKEALKASKHPLMAIGGISASNVNAVIDAGPAGIAAMSMALKKDSVDVAAIKAIQAHYR